jgi:thymidylate synthase (FAD)
MCRAKLVSYNAGPELVVLAVKTSAGKIKEKGVDYYLSEYPSRKPGELLDWLVKASQSFPSVLEHVVFTFIIEECSRVATHQLIRHRIASYTQESQRYSLVVDPSILQAIGKSSRKHSEAHSRHERLTELIALMEEASSKAKQYYDYVKSHGKLPEQVAEELDSLVDLASKLVVIPPSVRREASALLLYLHRVFSSLSAYYSLVAMGVPEEDARYLLPQSVKTRLMMTVNLRELIHIIALRRSPKAQWEIRALANSLMKEAKKVIQNIEDLVSVYSTKLYEGSTEK